MIPVKIDNDLKAVDIPRASGDDPKTQGDCAKYLGYSPRERG